MSDDSPARNDSTTVAIFLPTWVGDACMATAALRSIRNSFRDARIVGVMRPPIADLLAGLTNAERPWIDSHVVFEKPRRGGLWNRMRLVGQLRREKIDVGILLTGSLWTAAVMRMAGVRRLAGYDRDARGWLLSERLPVVRDRKKRIVPTPPVDAYLKLAGWIGCEASDRRMELAVQESDQQLADDLWRQLQFSPARPTIVINNGSATDSARVWPANRVAELSKRIADELDCQVLLHCGPGEREACNLLASRCASDRVASMGVADNLPIGLSKAVLQRATVVVSTDSGPRHITAALNRPGIVLYGATRPETNATYNTREYAIQPEGFENRSGIMNMQRIEVEDVFAAIQRMFHSTPCEAP